MLTIRNRANQTQKPLRTAQRQLLLEVLQQADHHLDADELHRRAREREPRISLATVYRNLKLFKELGLVEESNLGEAHSHYEIKNTKEHHHAVCLGCGEVIEFESPLISKVAAKVQRENDFHITAAQLKIEGYCSNCRQKT